VASTITLSVNVEVQSGPKSSSSLVETVETYGLTEVVIPKGAVGPGKEVQVPIVPAGPGQVRVLAITADRYQDLKYKAQDNVPALGPEVTLDAPQLFLGATVGLLGKTPNSLVFTNASTTDANVRILVGRKI
jgi:hypothetical protein